MPELPQAKAARFAEQYGLNQADVEVLTGSRATADYFEAVMRAIGRRQAGRELGVRRTGCRPEPRQPGYHRQQGKRAALAGLLKRIQDHTISGKIAKDVFVAMWEEGGDADSIIESKGLKQITDSGALEALVD